MGQQEEYKYYLKHPIGPEAVPKDFIHFDEDDFGKGGRYGAVYYAQPLTEKEVQEFELIPAQKKEDTIREVLTSLPSEREKYADMQYLRPSVTFKELDHCLRKEKGNPSSLLVANPHAINVDLKDRILKEYSKRYRLPFEAVEKRFDRCMFRDQEKPLSTNIAEWVRSYNQSASYCVRSDCTFQDLYDSVLHKDEDTLHKFFVGSFNEHPVPEIVDTVRQQLAYMVSHETKGLQHPLETMRVTRKALEDHAQDIKEFYAFEYPDDEQSIDTLKYGATFDAVKEALGKHENPEALLTDDKLGLDTVVRERISSEISKRYRIPYNDVYKAWFAHYEEHPEERSVLETAEKHPKQPEFASLNIKMERNPKTGTTKYSVRHYEGSLNEGDLVYKGTSFKKAMQAAEKAIKPQKAVAR